MKMKVLLSSIATIALCLCLIAGSTFALFTDTTEFNIAVTSGDVEIEAFATINSVYSAKGANVADDDFLVDENHHTYTHEKQTNGYFLNGGTAILDGRNLEIVRITPGDRVDVDINVTNKSDVAMVYRYKLISDNTNLATGMVVTIDGVSYESLALWTSEWYPVITAPNGVPNEIPVKTISIELPVYAGNEYQSEHTEGKTESVEYTIIVEAVQGNAVTDNESEVVIYNTAAILGNKAGTSYSNSEVIDVALTDAHVVKDLYLVGNSSVALNRTYETAIFENVTADVDGDLLTINTANTVVFYDCDITLTAGEKLVVANAGLIAADTQVMFHNVTLNGVLLTSANVGQYLENISNYFVW